MVETMSNLNNQIQFQQLKEKTRTKENALKWSLNDFDHFWNPSLFHSTNCLQDAYTIVANLLLLNPILRKEIDSERVIKQVIEDYNGIGVRVGGVSGARGISLGSNRSDVNEGKSDTNDKMLDATDKTPDIDDKRSDTNGTRSDNKNTPNTSTLNFIILRILFLCTIDASPLDSNVIDRCCLIVLNELRGDRKEVDEEDQVHGKDYTVEKNSIKGDHMGEKSQVDKDNRVIEEDQIAAESQPDQEISSSHKYQSTPETHLTEQRKPSYQKNQPGHDSQQPGNRQFDNQLIPHPSIPHLIETLKLSFNLLHNYTRNSSKIISNAFIHLADILCNSDVNDPTNTPLYIHATNCFSFISLTDFLEKYPRNRLLFNILCDFLSQYLLSYAPLIKDYVIDQDSISPQIYFLHTFVKAVYSQEKWPELQLDVENRLLPNEIDRQKPLGSSQSLSGTLIRIASDPISKTCRNLIFDTFWLISNQNSTTFIKNFGLGFSYGFLESLQNSAASQSFDPEINPVTGQNIANEEKKLDEMTEDEKLREAERLFVLFERLKKQKVLDIENPVAVAAREGRLG